MYFLKLPINIMLGLILTTATMVQALEFRDVQAVFHYLYGEFMESRTKKHTDDNEISQEVLDQIAISKGETDYNFIDFITYKERSKCLVYEYIDYVKQVKTFDGKKAPVKINCIEEKDRNGTLHIVETSKEILTLLASYGNSTKRYEEGNCALILFYTKSCSASAAIAPHFNAVPRYLPTLRIGAIDAYRFHYFNAEFGIVGLPTIMLFHQGRPVIKYNDTTPSVLSFVNFVTRHAGIKPISDKIYSTSDDFNGPLSNQVIAETDYYLYLAWLFILICSCHYFTKSLLYRKIIEVIKRNWRESEEQNAYG